MSKFFKKNVPLAIALVLLLVLVFSSALALTDTNLFAQAAPAVQSLGSIKLGHVSDIHYFPLEYCYQDVKSDEYKSTDFYHSMTGDTKLVLESGVIFNATIQGFIEDAKAGIAPTYVIASGDLSKNGERAALIDVANGLRYMQNSIRELGGKYENFQVFTTVGNHDLYNSAGALYAQSEDKSYTSDVVDAATFALIFAGLGFPDANLTGDDGAVNLTDFFPDDYWFSEFTGTYVESYNSPEITYHYYSEQLERINASDYEAGKTYKDCYFAIGHENNVLSYIAELGGGDNGFSVIVIDASDRVEYAEGVPVRVSLAEYNAAYSADAAFDKQKFYLADEIGVGSAAASKTEVEAAFDNGNAVYKAVYYDHLTGGRIVDECLDWIKSYQATQLGDGAADAVNAESYIAVFHQNVLPHFTQEDEILKDFTMYNWEYVAKSLLNMDIRYVMSGHMHASDIASYTNAAGKTLFDLETGSSVSYASPRRYVTLERYNADGALAERFDSSVTVLDSMAGYASTNIATGTLADWNDTAYNAAYAIWNANKTAQNWANVMATNPDYLTYVIHYNDFNSEDFNKYINDTIYSLIVDRLIDHFIDRDSLLATVQSAVGNILETKLPSILSGYSALLNKIVDIVLEDVVDNLYGAEGYVYDGQTYDDIFGYVKALAGDIVNMEFGGEEFAAGAGLYTSAQLSSLELSPLSLGEMATFILSAHSSSAEVDLSILANHTDSITAAQLQALLTDPTLSAGVNYDVPQNPLYRARFELALIDFAKQCDSGALVEELLDKLLDPLLTNENSIIKTLLTHEFDFTSEGRLTETEQNQVQKVLELALGMLKSYNNNQSVKLTIDLAHFKLGEVVSSLMPLIKNLAASMLNFNIEGDDILDIAEGFIDGYLVDSFYTGIGGILKQIVVSFATDDVKDVENIYDTSETMLVVPSETYGFINGLQFSYIAGVYMSDEENPATTENGRVPSRVSANFDTVNSTSSFTVKFYTAEDVLGGFKFADSASKAESGNWDIEVTTASAAGEPVSENGKKLLTYLSSGSDNGVSVSVKTVSTPVYVPYIDLGLLCLTHSQINFENDNGAVIWYGCDDRNAAEANSVIYWNVTTVTVTGLDADTVYYYDAEGVYKTGADSVKAFSLAQNNGDDYCTIKTAADKNADSFEFLTIADIQGMVSDMYTQSYAAMDAVLGSDSVNGYDFILNAGDVVDNGKNFNQWGYALDTYAKAFTNTSVFTAAGNHESGSYAMANYFNYSLPTKYSNQTGENGLFFSFDYGTAHFVVLDTNDADSKGLGKAQLKWLTSDLSANNKKWTVVMMHKSVFSAGSHSTDAEIVAMREQLVPLFNRYGVNIVFGGHDHTYTVTNLVNAETQITEAVAENGAVYTGSGVLFVTLGTMGTKFYNYAENANVTPLLDEEASVLQTLTSQTFGSVKIDGDLLTYTGYMYVEANNTVSEIGSVTLSADKNIALATLKSKNSNAPKVVSIGYFDKNYTENPLDLSFVPNDMSVVYNADGTEYANLSEIAVSGSGTNVKVMLVASDGTQNEIMSFTIEKENFVLYTVLFAAGGAIAAAGIVCAIVLPMLAKKGKLKKKGA
jgi:hypothetical protein